MFSRALSLAALALLPAVRSATFDVVVGGSAGLKYTPESVVAQPGDTVRFIFQQKNHTATQSTLANPCVKTPGGFDSGFIPVAADVTSDFQVAEYNVESTEPVWVYCKQGTHCQAGMVFAINPGNQMDAFKAAATGAAAPSSTGTAPAPSGTSTAGTPAGTGTPKDIRVVVGGPGSLTFNPPNIQAAVGDNIIFEFRQKNHAVVASTFEAPCVPLSQSAAGGVGFDSGYFPVGEAETVFPTWSVRVNDTRPIWAYCPQAGHCGQGMVFSANAVEGGDRSFSAFQDLAKQINGTGGGAAAPGGSGAIQSSISSAGAALAAIFAIAALL